MFLFKRLVRFVSQSTKSDVNNCGKGDDSKKPDECSQDKGKSYEQVPNILQTDSPCAIKYPLKNIDEVRSDIRSIWFQHWERLKLTRRDDLEVSEFENKFKAQCLKHNLPNGWSVVFQMVTVVWMVSNSEIDPKEIIKMLQKTTIIGIEWIQPTSKQNKKATSKASEIEWITMVSSAMLFWLETLWKSRAGRERRKEACSRNKSLSKKMNELFESVAQKKPRWKQWEKVDGNEDWGDWLSDVHYKR